MSRCCDSGGGGLGGLALRGARLFFSSVKEDRPRSLRAFAFSARCWLRNSLHEAVRRIVNSGHFCFFIFLTTMFSRRSASARYVCCCEFCGAEIQNRGAEWWEGGQADEVKRRNWLALS